MLLLFGILFLQLTLTNLNAFRKVCSLNYVLDELKIEHIAYGTALLCSIIHKERK